MRSIFTLVFALTASAAAQDVVVRPEAAPGPLDNPLKGYCVYTDAGEIHQPHSMVFCYASWKELEPEEGRYAFEAWEKKRWSHPKARGKHVVLRVYLDYPAKPTGVPDWLIDQGVAMRPYQDYGGGRSPDYDHPALVAGLEKLIAAMGRRYNAHPRVAFVQLGLLGFWGEWHTYPRDGLFASKATQARVLEAYRKAFPDKQLMARYPDGLPGEPAWIGYHDDMFPEDTDHGEDWSFLARMRRVGRAEHWKTTVAGGEMVPGAAHKWLGAKFDWTMQMTQRSHFSWVGPYGPALEQGDALFAKRSAQLVRRMGYQYRLEEIRLAPRIVAGADWVCSVRGVNEGVAPFYYPWPVELALLDDMGRPVARHGIKVDLRRWLPGAFECRALWRVPAPPGRYRLALGVIDPWQKKPSIRFANDLPVVGSGWTVLGKVEVVPAGR